MAIFHIDSNNVVQELVNESTMAVQNGDILVIGDAVGLANAALAANLPINTNEQLRAWALKANFPECNIVVIRQIDRRSRRNAN